MSLNDAKNMLYEFSYRTEEEIESTIKETGIRYPEVMVHVDCFSYEVEKNTLEEAIIDFLSRNLGTIWDIDPEVRVGKIKDCTYIGINAVQDYDKSWTINGLHEYSEIK